MKTLGGGAGKALVTIGKEVKEVSTNESVFVPLKTLHRLENQALEPLRIIEVQTGSYLGEDDIVRFADDFWRVSDEVENQKKYYWERLMD